MCGIAGIIWPDPAERDYAAPLRAMQGALRHRGPDDAGLFLSSRAASPAPLHSGQGKAVGHSSSGRVVLPDRLAAPQPIHRRETRVSCCGLVHTRLSILDLSPAGHQPMTTPDGRFTIVFNGEIYNFRELRDRLSAQGVRFASHSDTEVILHLYARCGPDCVNHLRGMFAFAIWDELEQSCFLARDPLGIKPLYYSQSASAFAFASELRALLAAGVVGKELDPDSVFGFFLTGTVPEPGTLLRGARLLEAGSWLLWKQGRTRHARYWNLRFQADSGDRAAASRCVREALLDSVRHHFVSDVPVGVFLSGGIDSTALVALSRAVGQQDLRTFSISFDDPRFNEGDVAQRTAGHFGTRHADWRLDAGVGQELFRDFLARFDQPSIDGFNTFTVSRFAREHGMKVVLSGLGGDELFGGYPSFRQVPRMLRASRCLGPLRGLVAWSLKRSQQPQRRRLADFFRRPPNLLAAYQTYRGVYSLEEAWALARHYTGREAGPGRETESDEAAAATMEDAVSELELTRYMRNQLLRDSDVMSMAWGLELRVPLVDRVLVETLGRFPAGVRLRPGKKLLLEAVPEVPEWVRSRPKRGFLFPFEQWLAGDWKDTFAATAQRGGVRAQTWYQKWSVFVFEQWCERNEAPLPSRI
jgi:asparagine synthase (glutamine-hydrolysing)